LNIEAGLNQKFDFGSFDRILYGLMAWYVTKRSKDL